MKNEMYDYSGYKYDWKKEHDEFMEYFHNRKDGRVRPLIEDKKIYRNKGVTMFKFLTRKYFPFKDYDENCKHKMYCQDSLSCRKRKDGTFIGHVTCKFFCKHNIGSGTNRRGDWIKCTKLKEALGTDD